MVVTSIILLVPHIGVVNVMLVRLAGQMVVSLSIDHHGWPGVLVLNRRALF